LDTAWISMANFAACDMSPSIHSLHEQRCHACTTSP
jgi:hypothetical protein